MKRLKIALFFCLLLAFSPPASAQSLAMPPLLVMVFGDELTSNPTLQPGQRFPEQLERKLRAIGFDLKVVHVGERDLTSVRAVEKLPSIIGKSPDVVILQIGKADMERGLSTAAFDINLTKIIKSLKEKNIYVVVIGAVPPAANGELYSKKVDIIYKIIKNKTSFYPHALLNVLGHPELTIGDGLQPNADGVGVMVDGLYRIVDSGLRWRLEVINQMRARQQQQMR